MLEFTAEHLKKLPPKARDKALRLSDLAHEDLGALRQAQRRKSELYAALETLDSARLERLERLDGAALAKEEEAAFDRKRDAIRTPLSRFKDTIPTLQAQWEGTVYAIDHCVDAITQATAIEAVASPKTSRSVEAIRSDLAALERRRAEVITAPLPRAHYIAEVEKTIEAEAQRGQVSFDPRIRESDPFKLRALLRSDGSATDLGAGVFLLWLFKGEIAKLLGDMIPDDGPATLTIEQRRTALADLEKRTLELEREEEAVIEAAAKEGRRIDRRPDADPRAILGVAWGAGDVVREPIVRKLVKALR